MRVRSIMIAILALLMASQAVAKDKKKKKVLLPLEHREGTLHWSAISGHATSDFAETTVEKSSTIHGLSFVQGTFPQDGLVLSLVTLQSDVNGKGEQKKEALTMPDPKNVNIETEQTTSFGPYRTIYGVQICTNAEGRIRGLRTWGAKIKKSGGLKRIRKVAEVAPDDCYNWHDRVRCKSGRGAIGIRAYFDRNHGIRGLQLQCAKFRRPKAKKKGKK